MILICRIMLHSEVKEQEKADTPYGNYRLGGHSQ